MNIPTYEKFIEPLLRVLASRPDGISIQSAHDATAEALLLTREQRDAVLANSGQPIYRNRCGWAHDRLKRAGLSASPKRGVWQITSTGMKFAVEHPEPFPIRLAKQLATEFMDVRLKPVPAGVSDPSTPVHTADTATALPSATPTERIDEALQDIRTSVANELLELLGRVSPGYFETVVLDVLHRMGYGANRADLVRVGGVGDGGIDGVISLDRLGLEKVYVQAKRWQGSVGSQEVQAFYGALAGRRASKGVFITTSSYSKQAVQFAASVDKIVLVDGARLAELMIEHEVGVSLRSLRVPKVDSDYFDET